MKKITLLLAAVAVSFAGLSQTTITHNNSEDVVDGLGLTCQSGGITTEGFDAGAYDWAVDFGVTGDFTVSEVTVGVDETIGAPGDAYSFTCNIYTTDSGTPAGLLTLVGSQAVTVSSADDLTVVSIVFATPAVVPAGEVMVVEFAFVDDTVTSFRIGGTDVVANDDSWIKSDPCGLAAYATYASIGFADRSHIVSAIGDVLLGVNDNIAELASVYPNPTKDVLNVAIPSNVEVRSAQLFDILGKDTGVSLINGQMSTSNLARGVYMLSVRTSAGTLTQKIIKE
jgi:hypothetical protein